MRGVERLVAIVDALAHGPATLTEIAGTVDLPKSTTVRFLRTLEQAGWIVREGDHYSHGAALVGMAARYIAGDALLTAASGPMQDLRDALGETVSMSRRVGLGRVCVQEYPSPQNLRLVLGLGEPGPLHAGASGVLLYAHLPEAERRRVAEAGLPRYTALTPTSFEELEAEADLIRERGWAMSRGQKTAGALAVAVPVRSPGPSGDVVALGLFGPELRASTESDRQAWLDALLRCADDITAALAR